MLLFYNEAPRQSSCTKDVYSIFTEFFLPCRAQSSRKNSRKIATEVADKIAKVCGRSRNIIRDKADKIDQATANRTFCKELGIRLSRPPPGQTKAGETDAVRNRQMYRDACERNVVESRNGNTKQRFGLDRIMAKLDETAKTEAILNVMAMSTARRVA